LPLRRFSRPRFVVKASVGENGSSLRIQVTVFWQRLQARGTEVVGLDLVAAPRRLPSET
jgi:hypothetical protein